MLNFKSLALFTVHLLIFSTKEMFYYLVRFPRGQQEEITAADSVTMMLYLFIEKSHNSLSSGVWLKPSGLIGRRTESQDSRSLHLKEREKKKRPINNPSRK